MVPDRMNIRQADHRDAEGIWCVQIAAIRQLCTSHYSATEIEAWAGPLQPGWYRNVIGERELFVAVEGETIIGFGQLNLNTAEVDAIYVHPAATRQGVGTALLRRLEDIARQHGLGALRLAASLNSVPFYDSMGFHRKRETRFPLLPGVEIASVVMEKALQLHDTKKGAKSALGS